MTTQIPLSRPLSENAKAALDKFYEDGERESPLKFIGRGSLLKRIANRLGHVVGGSKPARNPMVIEGPPGAGKSALLEEMARRNECDEVMPVRLMGQDLSHPLVVAGAFIAAAGKDPFTLGEKTQEQTQGKVGEASFIGMSHGTSTTQGPLASLVGQGYSMWTVIKSVTQAPSHSAFLVLIDEAQTVEPKENGKANPILFNMQHGHTDNVNCVLVFGGLEGTITALFDAGASPRLTRSVIRLDGFSGSECKQAIDAFFEHQPFELESAIALKDRQAMRRDIRIASEHYPRHVNCYLAALAHQLSGGGEAVNWDDVLDLGHWMRIEFCDGLLNQIKGRGLGDVLHHVAESHFESQSISLADIANSAQECGVDESPDEIVQLAVHCGVLSAVKKKHDQYHFPLPSMRTYLCHKDEDQCLAAMRANVDVRRRDDPGVVE